VLRSIHPADRASLAILAVIVATLAVGLPAGVAPAALLASQLGVHTVLLLAYGGLALWLPERRPGVAAPARGLAVILVMGVLYGTLATVSFAAVPWQADALLDRLDRWLFLGVSPALLADALASPVLVELLAFFYAAYIPFLYFSILLGLAGRRGGERDVFVTSFALLYAMAYMGYLFVPARGPIVELAGAYDGPLAGGPFLRLVRDTIDGAGGPHGAFPSLHVGASFLVMWFELRHRNRLRGLIYVPLVLAIAAATVVLRYHWVVDLLAGVALALLASWWAERLVSRWIRVGMDAAVPPSAPASSAMAPTPAYRLARGAWRMAIAGFFRRVDVQGAERVPPGPVLLVPNHANALVDPLLILTRLRRPVTLTAKSTLRRNPLLRPMIRALDVVEFHRRSDVDQGAEPERNAHVMRDVVARLRRGAAVCLFPEGISHSDPSMRPFRTGAARIALDYEAAAGAGAPPLRIVPVGLHYERKDRFRSAAALVFGEPLDVQDWRAARGADAQALTLELEERVRSLTLNFAAARESQAMLFAAELLDAGLPPAPLGLEPPERPEQLARTVLRLQRGAARLAEEEPRLLEALEARAGRLRRRLAALGVAPAELYLPLDGWRSAFFVVREAELALVGAPLAAWGWLNHALPYGVVRALTRRMSSDADHVASNAVFLSLPVFPLFWLLQTAAVAWLAGGWWAASYLLSLPLTGAIALLWRDRMGGALRRVRTWITLLRHPGRQREARDEVDAISGELRRLAARLEPHASAEQVTFRGTDR